LTERFLDNIKENAAFLQLKRAHSGILFLKEIEKILLALQIEFYLVLENPVLWTGSESLGSA